ncbi:MAG: ATP-binding protein [Rickettsiales bacterium]|jgi:predicted AAA+ superfamily ATPase|nr:ATP-binding protein [Rickettsiales bacterium]
MLINRPKYLEKLKELQDKPSLVKVITGARRCGKSKVLELFRNHLNDIGIASNRIQNINFEEIENDEYTDYKKLYNHILKSSQPTVMNYIFLDEIQLVPNWFKTVNSLRLKNNMDIYVTGSNAKMLDDDLHNEFGGRWMEIKMMPLSFKEFMDFQNEKSEEYKKTLGFPISAIKEFTYMPGEYNTYVVQGGFPEIFEFNGNQKLIKDYLSNTIYRDTIQRDIIKKYKLPYVTKLDDVARFVFENIGSETSLLNIEKSLTASGRKVDSETVGNYIQWLRDCFMIYRCERYDIKGKKLLSTNAKYYTVDSGLRYAILGHQDSDIGATLENIVYLELLRRGYTVYTGKIGKKIEIEGKEVQLEVDFVAEKNGSREYYQVCWTILGNEKILKREYGSLEEIQDNYPKYLITMDVGNGGQNGIKRINALDWLIDKSE